MHAFPGANDVRKNQNILEDNHRAALKLTDDALLTANAMEQTEVRAALEIRAPRNRHWGPRNTSRDSR